MMKRVVAFIIFILLTMAPWVIAIVIVERASGFSVTGNYGVSWRNTIYFDALTKAKYKRMGLEDKYGKF